MIGRREFLGFGAVLPLLVGSDPATLKIKRVEAYVLKIGARRDIVCARIETAEGIHGWGEGTTPPSSPAVLTQLLPGVGWSAAIVCGSSAIHTI